MSTRPSPLKSAIASPSLRKAASILRGLLRRIERRAVDLGTAGGGTERGGIGDGVALPHARNALVLALAEMYVQGVSTRKVKAITEQLCGVSMSSTQVSQAAQLLDAELEKWRTRPLGEYVYLFLDAYYEQVREDGQVRNLAVLVAVGVNFAGKREILGVSVSLSEHEIHWRTFLESLKTRGLGGLHLITSDAHEGLNSRGFTSRITRPLWSRG